MRIRFLSKNPHKIAEAEAILRPLGIEVIPLELKIEELQSADVEKIVRDKLLRAYSKIGHRLFVEQTCLYLDALNGFPGGLTQPFWDALQAERFCELYGGTSMTARTWIGYCDGKRIHHFCGEVKGSIPSEPQGSRDFQWDCAFVPDNYSQTFATMGLQKNEISMRRRALEAFAAHLTSYPNA